MRGHGLPSLPLCLCLPGAARERVRERGMGVCVREKFA
nr:MAG TPA: hypothetical protein [Caudoviricetes sp.]